MARLTSGEIGGVWKKKLTGGGLKNNLVSPYFATLASRGSVRGESGALGRIERGIIREEGGNASKGVITSLGHGS